MQAIHIPGLYWTRGENTPKALKIGDGPVLFVLVFQADSKLYPGASGSPQVGAQVAAMKVGDDGNLGFILGGSFHYDGTGEP